MRLDRKDIDGRAWLALPAIALCTVVFIIPAGWLLVRAFSEPSWGLQNFRAVLTEALYAKVAWNTIWLSVTVTLLCLILGYPVAYTLANGQPTTRRLLMIAILLPLWTSILVRSFAWMVLLQDGGIINRTLIDIGLIRSPLSLIYNSTGVLIAVTQVQLCLMVLPIYSVMAKIDPSLIKAALTLGGRPMRSFLRVYLPLSLPGVISGSTLTFVLCLGTYIAPAMVGGRRDTMIGQMIVMQIGDFGNWGAAAALSVLLLVGTMTIFGSLSWLANRSRRWIPR
jgi:ABC-type spermidine/putrescine transport system permease subunit I